MPAGGGAGACPAIAARGTAQGLHVEHEGFLRTRGTAVVSRKLKGAAEKHVYKYIYTYIQDNITQIINETYKTYIVLYTC